MDHIRLRGKSVIFIHYYVSPSSINFMYQADYIPRAQIVGGQWSCDYTIIQGSEYTIHYLIWYNHSVTVRQLLVCDV